MWYIVSMSSLRMNCCNSCGIIPEDFHLTTKYQNANMLSRCPLSTLDSLREPLTTEVGKKKGSQHDFQFMFLTFISEHTEQRDRGNVRGCSVPTIILYKQQHGVNMGVIHFHLCQKGRCGLKSRLIIRQYEFGKKAVIFIQHVFHNTGYFQPFIGLYLECNCGVKPIDENHFPFPRSG